MVIILNENSKITALTVYVPKKNFMRGKFKRAYLTLDRESCNAFFIKRKALLLSLLFLVFSYGFFYLMFFYKAGNAVVVSRFIANDYSKIFLFSAVFGYFMSNLPLIGKYIAVINGFACTYTTSALFYNHLQIINNDWVDVVISVFAFSCILFFTIIITLILYDVSEKRVVNNIQRMKFIKNYYIDLFCFLLLSTINYFIIKLFI